jgi:hypothetical protein
VDPFPTTLENVVDESAWTPDALPLPIAGGIPLIVVPVTVGGELGGSKVHEATMSAVQMEAEASATPKGIRIVFMFSCFHAIEPVPG